MTTFVTRLCTKEGKRREGIDLIEPSKPLIPLPGETVAITSFVKKCRLSGHRLTSSTSAWIAHHPPVAGDSPALLALGEIDWHADRRLENPAALDAMLAVS